MIVINAGIRRTLFLVRDPQGAWMSCEDLTGLYLRLSQWDREGQGWTMCGSLGSGSRHRSERNSQLLRCAAELHYLGLLGKGTCGASAG